VDVGDARTIGWRLRRVRDDRGKSLRVIAGLAGMSKATLSRIERGERSPTLNGLVALADALQISVSELIRLPVPAPAGSSISGLKTTVSGRQTVVMITSLRQNPASAAHTAATTISVGPVATALASLSHVGTAEREQAVQGLVVDLR
jgi:transcriptional regulator with XRE-family HTH domain